VALAEFTTLDKLREAEENADLKTMSMNGLQLLLALIAKPLLIQPPPEVETRLSFPDPDQDSVSESARPPSGSAKGNRKSPPAYAPVLSSKHGGSKQGSPTSKSKAAGSKNPAQSPHAHSMIIGGNNKAQLIQVYNQYTKPSTDFFDPYLQYGGETM
jgi:hypothetical protein